MLGSLLEKPRLRHLLSKGAEAHAAEFSWDRTAEGLLQVYREATTEHRALIASRLEKCYAW